MSIGTNPAPEAVVFFSSGDCDGVRYFYLFIRGRECQDGTSKGRMLLIFIRFHAVFPGRLYSGEMGGFDFGDERNDRL